MFLVYINKLISILENHGVRVKVFADEVKMYLKIVDELDFLQLQSALNSLHFCMGKRMVAPYLIRQMLCVKQWQRKLQL